MSRQDEFAKSSPTPLRTFADLRAARTYAVSQITEDLTVHSEARRQKLQRDLQDLVLQINTVQARFATDQRECLLERERLATELARLKVSEEIRRKQATIAHLAQLNKIRADHAASIAQLNQTSLPERTPRSVDRSMPIEQARATLKTFEQSLRDLKRSSVERPPPDPSIDLLSTSLLEIRRQKETIIEDSKSAENESQKKLVELVVALDEQAADYQREITEHEKNNAEQEKQYERELAGLLSQVASVQQRRRTADEQRRQRLVDLQKEITAVQSDFAEKMENARRVAETLRIRLTNAKMREENQLRNERQRSGETNQLFKENAALRVRVSKLEAEILLAKDTLAGIRRELSATIGPRRTQSLFI